MATTGAFTDESGLPREVSYEAPLPVTTSYGGRLATKTVAFTGAAGLGAVGTVNLFTVTGNVFMKIFGVCTENLAAAGGTIEVGTANNTAALIAQTTSTAIDANEIWYNNTPVAEVTASSNITEKLVANGADVIATIATNDITDGTIVFYCYWEPLTSTGSVVAA